MADKIPPLQQNNPLVDEKGRGKPYFILWLNNLLASTVGSAIAIAQEALELANTAIAGLANKVNRTGDTMTGDLSVPDEAFGPGWNGSAEVPTKNAIFDKFATFVSGIAISKDDTPVASSVTELNFEGSGVASVVNDGGGKVTATISGGGGGGSPVLIQDHLWGNASSASGAASATKGLYIIARDAVKLWGVTTYLTAKVNGATYVGYLVSLTGNNVNTILATSAAFVAVGTARETLMLKFPASVTLVKGVRYGIAVSRTDSTGTYKLPVPSSTGSLWFTSAAIDNDGYFTIDTAGVSNGATVSSSGSTLNGYTVGVIYEAPVA